MIRDLLAVGILLAALAGVLFLFAAAVGAGGLGLTVAGLAAVAAVVWAIDRVEGRLAGRSR